MLLQNGTILAQYPFTLTGGGTASFCRACFGRGDRMNIFASEGITSDIAAVPNGHLAPSAWILPKSPGGLSTYGEVIGTGEITASILAVKLAQAGLTGSGDLDAVGALIVSLLADLLGSGEISDADVKAFLQLAADIAGSGEVSDAALTGLGALVAALLGDGTAANSILTGNGAMAADLVVTGTGLTTSNVGQAVWSALAASNNVTGTMGEKLNDAGSAGNPWAALLADNVDPDTFGWLINQYIDAKISEVKAKTDNLTFTVAGQVDANTKSMNDSTVNGTGAANDLWRGS